MEDRPRWNSTVNPPFSGGDWSPLRLRAVSGPLCQTIDMTILTGVYLAIAVLPISVQDDGVPGGLLQPWLSPRNLLLAVMCLSTWWVILTSLAVYTPGRTRSLPAYVFRCVVGLNSCTAVVGLIEVVLHAGRDAWHLVEMYWLACLVLMTLARVVLLLFDRTVRRDPRRTRNVLIVGSGERAEQVFHELQARDEWDYRLVGFVDSEVQGGFVPEGLLLGGIGQLEEILPRMDVDEVVIALPLKSHSEVVGHAISVCQRLGVESQYFTDYFDAPATMPRYTGAESRRMVLEDVTQDYRLQLKRLVDLSLSLLAVVALAPVLAVTALAVKLTSPGPVLFRQKRYGLNQRRFEMLKFRSMCLDGEARLTPIGGFIRRTSLDELPQLFNVLAGDMSLVGPRPLPPSDVQQFSDSWLMRRFSVKPGVTCLGQIVGRSNEDSDRCIELDLEYVDNWSLSLDALILLKTIPAMLTGR